MDLCTVGPKYSNSPQLHPDGHRTGAAPCSDVFVAARKIAYRPGRRPAGARVAVNRGEGLHGHVMPDKETCAITRPPAAAQLRAM
jgi:hypothetical protein